ncbi:MAG: ABC transporter substrate-binding protein, partial [Thalassobaculaceae bacterium]
SSPISENTPAFLAFTARYRERFKSEPDAFALGQYDAMKMMIAALEAGADTPAKMRDWLAANSHTGLAMTYRSDGKGNMAHDAVIICYDGAGRVPAVVKRYRNVGGQG